MRVSIIIISFAAILQLVVYVLSRIAVPFFASYPLLKPFPELAIAVVFVLGALIDFFVGSRTVQSKSQLVLNSRRRAIVSGATSAIFARFFGTIIGLLFMGYFIIRPSELQSSWEPSTRGIFLLNMFLITLVPTCSAVFIGAVFGGLGAFVEQSRANSGT